MNSVLALFPLNTVLFPGTALSLKIFELRYLEMIQECLDKSSPLGIIAIESGPEVGGLAQPVQVGCVASIEHVKKKADGTLDILVRGKKRFKRVKDFQKEPYWRCEVQLLEENGSAEEAVVQELRRLMEHYSNIFMLVTGKPLEYERRFENIHRLSWFLSDLLQASDGEKQKLLEIEDCGERLKLLVPLLARELEFLKAMWLKYKYQQN